MSQHPVDGQVAVQLQGEHGQGVGRIRQLTCAWGGNTLRTFINNTTACIVKARRPVKGQTNAKSRRAVQIANPNSAASIAQCVKNESQSG